MYGFSPIYKLEHAVKVTSDNQVHMHRISPYEIQHGTIYLDNRHQSF